MARIRRLTSIRTANTYDTAGRLTDVTKNGAAYSHYVYDSNGNRTSGTVNGQTISASYDNQDGLNSYNSLVFTYSLAGELYIVGSPHIVFT